MHFEAFGDLVVAGRRRVIANSIGNVMLLSRFVIVLLLGLHLVGLPARGEGVATDLADGEAMRATIAAQVEAFRSGDLSTAFLIASPAIQALFGDPHGFARMVQEGYPMVWRPAELRFLGARQEGCLIWQRVLIRDLSGGLHVLDYQMVDLPGGWRINGVIRVPSGTGV